MSFFYRWALVLVLVIPGFAWAFPTLKTKEQFLPVLHALITIQDEVTIEGFKYKVEFKKDANGAEDCGAIRKFFSGDAHLDTKFTEAQLEALFKTLAHVFDITVSDGAGKCPFMHGGASASSSSKSVELNRFLNAVMLMILNRGEHSDAHVENLKGLITFTSFDFIDRVLKGRVRQRYRLKVYNPETKTIQSFEFYLRDLTKSAKKEVKVKKVHKKK